MIYNKGRESGNKGTKTYGRREIVTPLSPSPTLYTTHEDTLEQAANGGHLKAMCKMCTLHLQRFKDTNERTDKRGIHDS